MKKLIALVLGVVCILSIAVMPTSAIQMSDTPIPSPDAQTKWDADGLMYEGEPAAASPYSNAWTNEPEDGGSWYGLKTWYKTEVDGIPCIAVSPFAGKNEAYMDFNYYQWNNDYYYPSLICQDYPYFAAKVSFNQAAVDAMREKAWGTYFYAKTEDVLGSGGNGGTSDVLVQSIDRAYATAGEWYIEVFDLSVIDMNGVKWMDDNASIRQCRYYPFGAGAAPVENGEIAYVAWLGFFKTAEEALAYDPYYVEPETEAPAPETEAPSSTTTESAQTADVVSLTVAAAVVSLGLAVVVSKKF